MIAWRPACRCPAGAQLRYQPAGKRPPPPASRPTAACGDAVPGSRGSPRPRRGIPVSAELGQALGKRGEHDGVVRRREDDDRQIQAQVAERRRGVDGWSDLAVRAEPDMAGQHDLRRVAPDVAAVGMKHITLGANSSGGPEHVAPGGVLGGGFEGESHTAILAKLSGLRCAHPRGQATGPGPTIRFCPESRSPGPSYSDHTELTRT